MFCKSVEKNSQNPSKWPIGKSFRPDTSVFLGILKNFQNSYFHTTSLAKKFVKSKLTF